MLVRAAVDDETSVEEEVEDGVELGRDCVEENVVIVEVGDKEAVDEDVVADADAIVVELGAEDVEIDAAEVADVVVRADAVEEKGAAEEAEAACDVDEDDTAGLEAVPEVLLLVLCALVEDAERVLEVDVGIFAADDTDDEADVDDVDAFTSVLLLERAETVVVGVTVLVVMTVTTGVV